MTNGVQVGRLAMRQEGGNWVAYFAKNETMKDAIFIGSISLSALTSKERKDEFRNLMRDIVSDIIEDLSGVKPEWGDVTSAPEHEKSGNA